jgi:hypothetical protein
MGSSVFLGGCGCDYALSRLQSRCDRLTLGFDGPVVAERQLKHSAWHACICPAFAGTGWYAVALSLLRVIPGEAYARSSVYIQEVYVHKKHMHKLLWLHDTVGSVRPRRDTQRLCSTLSHIQEVCYGVCIVALPTYQYFAGGSSV